jgi:cellulose synthase/poly-beta-1,6-N-acetylglucosamine synthase-like glycosyltransferase
LGGVVSETGRNVADVAAEARACVRTAVTVIVPAYNEAASIAETIESLRRQTFAPAEIIVVDDCSDDGTGEIASSLGATVLRPDTNTGSKAGAQTFALPSVSTALVMAVDADTALAPDAIEKLLEAMDDSSVAAACGYVLPRRVRTLWERGRYIEYLFAFSFFKQIQDYYEKPLISSGCFSVYRTDALRRLGGWSTRTMAEDMDLTWSFYQAGWKIRFVPAAVCYPIEPHNLEFMRKQLRRWSHGFVQNVRLHWRGLLHLGYLRSVVAVACYDALIASLAFLVALPMLALLVSPLFLLGYVLDAPAVIIPVAVAATHRRELRRALLSFPCFYVLRVLNAAMMLKAIWLEGPMRRPLLVYEKGH